MSLSVFEFLDYRDFLRRYYELKKAEGRGFSYRAFSRRAGLSAPNHLKRVIDGARNLSAESARKYAKALGLQADESNYFCDLVAFNQARSHDERSDAYQRMTGSRGYRKTQKLDLAHAAYHAEWFIPAVRELAARKDFNSDPDWIAERIRPRISSRDAARALSVLLELGLLTEANGSIEQSETLVATGPETRGLHIVNYHRAMLQRASEAMDEFSAAQRDISSLTFCVGEDGLRVLKERLERFRQELIDLALVEDDPDQVVQLNLQLFPLSASKSDEEPS